MSRKGFTLIEIILVSTIFAVLSAAVFVCLSNGIKLWEKGRQLVLEEDVAVFFDRISSELRNSFDYSEIPFTGRESEVNFPTVVWTPADRVSVRASEEIMDQIGRVQYAYDPEKKVLVRRQANYSDALAERWGDEQTVVSGIAGVRFRYFYSANRDPQIGVDDVDGVPAGVEAELIMSPVSTKTLEAQERIFKRYIAIPAGV